MKIFKFISMSWLIVFVLASNSFAQEYNCQNPQYQQEMNFCAYQNFLAADEMLNEEYQRAIAFAKIMDADLSDDLKGAERMLRQAQRDWIKYRDSACEAVQFLARGGTLEPVLVSSCKAKLTRQRTEVLSAFMWQLSGDGSN